jgi:hypothetical protein
MFEIQKKKIGQVFKIMNIFMLKINYRNKVELDTFALFEQSCLDLLHFLLLFFGLIYLLVCYSRVLVYPFFLALLKWDHPNKKNSFQVVWFSPRSRSITLVVGSLRKWWIFLCNIRRNFGFFYYLNSLWF